MKVKGTHLFHNSLKAQKGRIIFPCIFIPLIILAIYSIDPTLTHYNAPMISTHDNFGALSKNVNYESNQGQAHILENVKPYKRLLSVNPNLPQRNSENSWGFEKENRTIHNFFFNEYVKFHKDNRFTSARYLIFCPRPGAGIGDRARWFVMAYWMAVLSRRILILDGNSSHPLSTLVQSAQPDLNLFYDIHRDTARNVTICTKKPGCHALRLNASRRSDAPAKERSNEDLLLSNTKTLLFDCSTSLYVTTKFLKFHAPKEISAALIERYPRSAIFRRNLFSNVLSLRTKNVKIGDEELSKQLSPIFSFYTELPKTNSFQHHNKPDISKPTLPYVSVHARLGEGLGEYESRFSQGINNKHRLAQCLAKKAVYLVKTIPPPRIIFLATDTSSFRELFDRAVQSVTDSKNILVIWNNRNISHSVSWRMITDHERQENTFRLLEDVFLLGRARHMVAIYSLFARFSFYSGCAENLIEIEVENCIP